MIKREREVGLVDESREMKRMDGLNLLRYVTQQWPKEATIEIFSVNINESYSSFLAA